MTLGSNYLIAMALMGVCVADAAAQPVVAQACNPRVGRANARIECLTKMVDSLTERLASLDGEQQRAAKASDLSGYLKTSELDSFLAGYVKYNSPLAINLFSEPRTRPEDGRCLEAYIGEVGVVAGKPCNFEKKKEIKWQLLPVSTTLTAR